MLGYTRRVAFAFLLAAAGACLVPPTEGRAQDDAANEDQGPPECYESQKFGDWFGRASDRQGGALFNDVPFTDPKTSPLRADIQASVTYDTRVTLYGDPDKVTFTKDFLIDPDNRLIVKDASGATAVDAPLCGNCNNIEEDKFSVVLPLATVPTLRQSPTAEFVFKLKGQPDSGFKLTLGNMRKALLWANARKADLATQIAEGKCVSPGIVE